MTQQSTGMVSGVSVPQCGQRITVAVTVMPAPYTLNPVASMNVTTQTDPLPTVVLTAIGVSDWELTVTVQYPGPWWRRWWLTLRQWVRDRRDR